MRKLTDNKNWNVYEEECGMSSLDYFVMLDDELSQNMSFVNDKKRAFDVCDALNKCNVE